MDEDSLMTHAKRKDETMTIRIDYRMKSEEYVAVRHDNGWAFERLRGNGHLSLGGCLDTIRSSAEELLSAAIAINGDRLEVLG